MNCVSHLISYRRPPATAVKYPYIRVSLFADLLKHHHIRLPSKTSLLFQTSYNITTSVARITAPVWWTEIKSKPCRAPMSSSTKQMVTLLYGQIIELLQLYFLCKDTYLGFFNFSKYIHWLSFGFFFLLIIFIYSLLLEESMTSF